MIYCLIYLIIFFNKNYSFYIFPEKFTLIKIHKNFSKIFGKYFLYVYFFFVFFTFILLNSVPSPRPRDQTPPISSRAFPSISTSSHSQQSFAQLAIIVPPFSIIRIGRCDRFSHIHTTFTRL